MKPVLYLFLILFLLPSIPLLAQEEITLEKAVELALNNNLQLRQIKTTAMSAEINHTQAKYNFLPDLNANANLTRSYGTTIDQLTLRRVDEATSTSSPRLSSSVVVFNGFANWANLNKTAADLAAAYYAIQKTENTIVTQVILAFFQVVYDRENLRISRDREELISKQVERARKQLDAGVITKGDLLTLEAQLSSEELNRITQANMLERDMLTLIQLLEIDPFKTYEIVVPDPSAFAFDDDLPEMRALTNHAVESMPEMKEKEKNIESAEYSLKSSKGQRYPSLTLSGNISTFYSSNARLLNPITFQYGEVIPVGDQLDNNFSQSLTLSLNIPIFNRWQTQQSIELSKINLYAAQLDYEVQKNTLVKEIQQAYLDVAAAEAKYQAAQKQLRSLEESFQYAQIKYEAGLMDFYSYIEILNNKTKAETELLQAQYDYLLKIKILDIYQGKKITFE